MVRMGLVCLCLLVPRAALAGPIIWEAVGELTASVSSGLDPTRLPPPVGTPYHVQFTFDPNSVEQTPLSPSGAGCNMTAASMQMTLGGVTVSGAGNGFTNSQLPGDNCGGNSTEFFFSALTTSEPNPWPWDGPAFLLLSYRDLLFQDAFPGVPTPAGLGSMTLQNDFWQVRAPFTPAVAVQNPTPVPEPATMLLFGVGLAAVARRVRRVRYERRI